MKSTMKDFKKKHFVPYLRNGDSIFESACGIGLNLFATLEILQEYSNITHLNVYGNEYLSESTVQANRILQLLTNSQGAGNQVRSICQGDSSDLSFIPADSFDLVFTGYITPLQDPLNMDIEGGESGLHRLKRNCLAIPKLNETSRWKAVKVRDMMQERQNEWFSNWFQQMIRIAKPGSPVIVEEVAPPLCQDPSDWGGVSRQFWQTGVGIYGWDVDPESLEFGSRSGGSSLRYHVFFLKNKASRD
mmetsp:Transcript_13220/g.38046  ORF Transcript_13220/g.38046 Transcript_13220/m.38046 type:complete len:246 (-) Transcript_13220:25-762(-)